MNAAATTARAPHGARRAGATRRAARSPYSADAALWIDWCQQSRARLDAVQRAADAVAWCSAGHATAFALPSKLRTLNAEGVARVVETMRNDPHPRLSIHALIRGEGEAVALARDGLGCIGHLGLHHATWIQRLPPAARAELRAVVLQTTGGSPGKPSRGLNIALTGIGNAIRAALDIQHAARDLAAVLN